MTRRSLDWATRVGLLAALLLGSVACTRTEPQPADHNFILISLDTLRADHLGLYGYEKPTSPFLDGLSEKAVVYDNAFAQYPNTLTSHMSMLTGLYPAEHDVYPPASKLSPEIHTLAERLQARGFSTGGFTEGGYMRGVFGFRRGFDEFVARDRHRGEQVEQTFRRGLGYLERTLDSAPDKPFFLFLHTYAVHAPYEPPPEFRAMFWQGDPPADAFEPIPANLLEASDNNLPQSEAALDYYRALYNGEIRHLDDVLRRFFERLQDLPGLLDNTTIIITSDHGEEFRDHGQFNHHQLYHETIRVPLLVLAPGVEPRRSQRMVELVDITPTVLDLAAVAGAKDLSGTSLAPELSAGELSGTSSYPKRFAYAETGGGRRSLYSQQDPSTATDESGEGGAAKLFHFLSFPQKQLGATKQPIELYLTSEDPAERHNIAPSSSAEVKSLSTRLEQLMHRARAQAQEGELDEDLRKQLEALGYLQ